ncbi:MAG: hypothetical protein R3D03_07810 [Geminicoccaceae bacterium]
MTATWCCCMKVWCRHATAMVAGAEHRYSRLQEAGCSRCSIPSAGACSRRSSPGDACGIRGADIAHVAGELAGLAASADLGALSGDEPSVARGVAASHRPQGAVAAFRHPFPAA